MRLPENPAARADLWVALGNQPGVSAWFAVYLLSRLGRMPKSASRRAVQPAGRPVSCG